MSTKVEESSCIFQHSFKQKNISRLDTPLKQLEKVMIDDFCTVF